MQVGGRKLEGRKVAILAGDGFEYVELSVPKRALESAGAVVDVVSLHDGRIRGMNLTTPTKTVHVDVTVHEVDVADYDALFLVGGFVGPDFVRQSAAARELVRAFDETDKPIGAICHGPWVLVSSGVVHGRKLASWPSLRDDVVNAGGIWRNEAVVRDKNWISSRGPQDLSQLVPAMIDLFACSSAAERTALPLHTREVEASSSPLDEPVAPALRAARVTPGPAVFALLGAALGVVGTLAIGRALA